MRAPTEVDRPVASGLTVNPTTYPVRFRRFATVVANDFALSGAGEIAFSADTVIVRGKRGWGFAGTLGEFRFARERIFDATRFGRLIWFMAARTPDEPAQRMVLYPRSKQDAEAVLAALPANLSERRARATAEADDFADKLFANTPRLWVTPTLVWINLIIFALMAIAGAGILTPDPSVHVRFGSNYGPLTAGGQWWRLFTSMFLHFGILHVALNMWALRDGGGLIERLLGNWTMLFVYCFAGVAGSAASLAWNPGVNSAGASGAVFGIYGALLCYVLDRRNGVPLTVMKEIRFSLLMFIGYAVFIGLTSSIIDNAAHFGGLLAGSVAAFALARPLDPATRLATPRWRLPVIAVLLAGVASWGVLAAIDFARYAQEDKRFQLIVPAFAASQQRLNAVHQRALTAIATGGTNAQAGAALFHDQADRWRQLENDLNGLGLRAGTSNELLRNRLARLANMRARAAALLSEAIATNDANKARDANELLGTARALEGEIGRALQKVAPERKE